MFTSTALVSSMHLLQVSHAILPPLLGRRTLNHHSFLAHHLVLSMDQRIGAL